MKKIWAVITAFIIISSSLVLAHILQVGAEKLPTQQYFPTKYTVAVWDWTSPLNRSGSQLNELNNFYYMHQINTVYLDIGDYVKFYQQHNQSDINKLSDSISRYIDAMKNRHIAVYAAAGNTDWSKPSERNIPLAIQKYVFSYNSAHKKSKLTGLELDIEAYNQNGFSSSSMTEKTITLSEYLTTVQDLTNHQKQDINRYHNNLTLGFAIPYWFDNENGNIPDITWNGKTGPTLYHLVDTINQLKSSNIVVMAYRNASNGNDGVIFHSRTEVEYTAAKASNVKVIIGQEVNNVEPSKETYYQLGISSLSTEVGLFTNAFQSDKSYGGVAINDIQGLQQLSSQ